MFNAPACPGWSKDLWQHPVAIAYHRDKMMCSADRLTRFFLVFLLRDKVDVLGTLWDEIYSKPFVYFSTHLVSVIGDGDRMLSQIFWPPGACGGIEHLSNKTTTIKASESYSLILDSQPKFVLLTAGNRRVSISLFKKCKSENRNWGCWMKL